MENLEAANQINGLEKGQTFTDEINCPFNKIQSLVVSKQLAEFKQIIFKVCIFIT